MYRVIREIDMQNTWGNINLIKSTRTGVLHRSFPWYTQGDPPLTARTGPGPAGAGADRLGTGCVRAENWGNEENIQETNEVNRAEI